MRVGIVGTGKFGENHIRILKELGHEIYIFDTDEKRQKEMSEKYNVADFFVDSIMDAVVIATPSDTHYRVAKPFLEKGINVLVEKPLCLKTSEAKELVKLAEKNDAILATGTVFRFTQGALTFRKFMDELDVEKVVMRFYNTKAPRTDSNILFNLGIHFIDLLMTTKIWNSEKTMKAEYSDDKGIIYLTLGKTEIEIKLLCNAERKIRDADIISRTGRVRIDLMETGDEEPLLKEDRHFLRSTKTKIQPRNKANWELIKILEDLS